MNPKTYPVLQAQLRPKSLELAIALLYPLGITTFEEKRKGPQLILTAEIPAKIKATNLIHKIRKLEKNFEEKKIFQTLKILKIKKSSWADAYQKTLEPFTLLKLKNESGSKEIKIDPRGKIPKKLDPDTLYIKASLAFGTGTHATTQLASILLQEALAKKANPAVLDLGCGTAILGMLAEQLGAREIIAIDNDPEALQMAEENLSINKIKKVKLGNDIQKIRKKFPVIVANITLNVLIDLQEQILSRLLPGGLLIVSGLLYRDCAELIEKFHKLTLLKRMNRKGWSAMLLQN